MASKTSRYKNLAWRKLRFLIAFILLSFPTLSQIYPVQVNIIPIPPYRDYLASYAEENKLKVIITLTDFNSGPINVRLRMTMTGPNYSFTSDVPPNLIYTLQPGLPIILTGDDLVEYFNESAAQTGFDVNELQQGNTQICFDVLRINNNEVLSTNACAYFFLEEYQPPQHFQPQCNSTVAFSAGTNENLPDPIIFSFSPLAGYAGIDVTYDLLIYEILDPTIQVLTPPNGLPLVYSQTVNNINTVVLQPIDNPLINGRNYVWYVRAMIAGSSTQIANQGYSVPCRFQFGTTQSIFDQLASSMHVVWNPSAGLAAVSDRKGKAKWLVENDDPTSNVVFEQFVVSYRKKAAPGEELWAWFEDTVPSFELSIYQLEPSTTYEAFVVGLLGGASSDPTEIREFTTNGPRAFACGVPNLPDAATTYVPLPEAQAGDKVRIGMFDLEFTTVASTGTSGHYEGQGLVPIDFLYGASAKVKFTDLKIDQEYNVVQGTAEVLTEGLDAWLQDQYQQFQDPIFVIGVVTNAWVADSLAYITVNGVDSSFTFPCSTCPVIINDISGNQITIYPNGTVIWSSYLDISNEFLGADEDEIGIFAQANDEVGGFDAKEHLEWHENYEIIRTQDSVNYFVANKSMFANQSDLVLLNLPADEYNLNDDLYLQFENSTDKIYPTSNNTSNGNLVLKFTIPGKAKGEYQLYGYSDITSLAKLRVIVYEKEIKNVVIVPLAATALTESEIKTYLDATLGEAGFEFNVSVADQFSTADVGSTTTFNVPDATVFTKYTKQMRNLRDEYLATVSNADDAYYLFMVASLSDTVQNTSIDGYMVRGKKIGFITANSGLQTIAHELGHGMGALPHSWKDNGPDENSTNNLLDYNGGNNLILQQWEELRKPKNSSFFDEEEDLQQLQTEMFVFPNVTTFDYQIPSQPISTPVHYTQSGITFGADITDMKYNSCNGGLESFWYQGEFYSALRTGYNSSDGTTHINRFIGFTNGELRDSLNVINNSFPPGHIFTSQERAEASKLQWEIIERHNDKFFTDFDPNATGKLFSTYNSTDCKLTKTIFNVLTPLKTNTTSVSGYPLSGGLSYIGSAELEIFSSETLGPGTNCNACWVTMEEFAAKNDYFPKDSSGRDSPVPFAPGHGFIVKKGTLINQQPIYQQLVDKFVSKINANLRNGTVHNYNGIIQQLHLIGFDNSSALNDEQKEIIEHKLAYLYDYTKDKNSSSPIEFYVVLESTALNGEYYLLDGFNNFALDVYENSALANKNAILITIPWGKYSSQLGANYQNNRTTYMPGLYSRSEINYSGLKTKYENQAYNTSFTDKVEISKFILDVYTYTAKPVKIHKIFQEIDGSISHTLYNPDEYKSGYPFCKEIALYRKPGHLAIQEENVVATGIYSFVDESGAHTIPMKVESDYLRYEIELAQLIQTANQSDWQLFTPTGDIAKLKEKYIDSDYQAFTNYAYSTGFDQWITDVYFATQVISEDYGIPVPPALTSSHYYTVSTWTVFKPIVYGALDVIGLGLSFVGLDGITDGVGLLISSATGDYEQAIAYTIALTVPFAAAGTIKLVKEIPAIYQKSKIFFKGANYLYKNGEWVKMAVSYKYGKVLTFFKMSDDLVTPAEVQLFVQKFQAGEIENSTIAAIRNAGTGAEKKALFQEVVQGAGTLVYKSDFATHMTDVVGFTQQRGVIGGHNLSNFENYLTNNAIEINRLSTTNGSLDGLVELTYQIKKADGSGGWKSGYFKKTLYDPSKITDAQVIQWGKEAMEEGISSNRIRIQTNSNTIIDGTSNNGMKFTGYRDPNSGEILNFHPVLNW